MRVEQLPGGSGTPTEKPSSYGKRAAVPEMNAKRERRRENRSRQPNQEVLLPDSNIKDDIYGSADDNLQDRWSTVPCDLLSLILKRLSCARDCSRFGAVCKWWQYTLMENQCELTPCAPLLLIPNPEDWDPAGWKLLDLNTNTLVELPSLLDIGNKNIVGSSFGWLVTVEYSNPSSYEMELFNPITKVHIPLPPMTTFAGFHDDPLYPFEHFVGKTSLSSNPNSDSACMVMVTYGMRHTLGYCKVGDTRWTSLDHESLVQFLDLKYHMGRFYAATEDGIIVECLLGPDPKLIIVAQKPSRYNYFLKYLVSAGDQLLMVSRDVNWPGGVYDTNLYKTERFVIDRLDIPTSKWEEVKSLEDRMLFLGMNCAISVSSDEMYGCKPNHIYFVNEHPEWYAVLIGECYDMGVYSLEDDKIRPFYRSKQYWPSPMCWLTPAPW